MWLRYRQQQRKKRKWKERLAEKKRSQEGTKRKEYHRAVRSLIIVFHKDNLKIWIGGYERQTITSVGYQLKCRLLLSCWNADAEAKSSQFLMFSNLGVGEGMERGTTDQLCFNCIHTVFLEKMWCLIRFTL